VTLTCQDNDNGGSRRGEPIKWRSNEDGQEVVKKSGVPAPATSRGAGCDLDRHPLPAQLILPLARRPGEARVFSSSAHALEDVTPVPRLGLNGNSRIVGYQGLSAVSQVLQSGARTGPTSRGPNSVGSPPVGGNRLPESLCRRRPAR